MEILIGKTAGFCYGVQRAIEGANKQIKNSESEIYCLGELVHNKQVINELEKKGIKFIEDYKQVENTNSKLIIRAHGIPKNIYENAEKKGIKIKDFTCPKVEKVHKIASKYSENEYFIFLCGKRNHPENIGTISFCGQKSFIIEEERDIEDAIEYFKKTKLKKLLIIAQTTFNVKKFINIENVLREKLDKTTKIIVKNTICRATEIRQKETEELSKKVEFMIIIGGKNSSNTTKLYEIAKLNCKNAYHIETVDELNKIKIKKYNVIGIMAGASTPKESIEQLVEYIEKEECMA